jgi:hypothetical protein
MLAEVNQGELITVGHPYYRNLPAPGERPVCPCGAQATALVLVPGQRLDRCRDCYRLLAPYLDPSCHLVFIGAP